MCFKVENGGRVMKTLMIVNRADNWFDSTDVELDECYIAIKLLERLYSRKKMGLDYDRFSLSSVLYDRSSSESIAIVDKAIVLLISRNLICFNTKHEGKRKLVITEQGEFAYNKYKEELKK